MLEPKLSYNIVLIVPAFSLLSQELNDQEVLTLMRRFKDGDQYMYEEMCDLISHVYAKNRNESPTGASTKRKGTVAEANDLETFKQNARLRTIQWRRYIYLCYCVRCEQLVMFVWDCPV